MTQPRHDVIFPLRLLNAYPGAEWMDTTFFLPRAQPAPRRLWIMAPSGAPVVAINDARFAPQRVVEGPPRWLDYGVVEVPTGFTQLRLWGISGSEPRRLVEWCQRAYLIVTPRTDLCLDGCDLSEAQRRLWGIASCDAGATTLHPSRLTVGSPADFAVRYTAGPGGLPAGARIRFAVPKAFTRPQTQSPSEPGAVTVGHNPGISIAAIEDSVESHEAVDIICVAENPLLPGQGFELSYRTARTHIFPVAFHETERLYWYSRLPPLAAAVALSADSPFVALDAGNAHTFELVPGAPARLHLFLPGRRRRGDPSWI